MGVRTKPKAPQGGAKGHPQQSTTQSPPKPPRDLSQTKTLQLTTGDVDGEIEIRGNDTESINAKGKSTIWGIERDILDLTITDDMSTKTEGLGLTLIFGAQVHAHPSQPKKFSDPQDVEFDLSREDLFSVPINYGTNEHVTGVDYMLVDTLPYRIHMCLHGTRDPPQEKLLQWSLRKSLPGLTMLIKR